MGKQSLKTACIILLISAYAISCRQTDDKRTSKSIQESAYKIGVSLPLTGNGSYFAEELKKGLDLAFDRMSGNSEETTIEVIYEDNRLNPKDAVGISKIFLEVDDVDLIICGYTPIIQATIKLVNDHEIPMLVTCTSAEAIATDYDWVFRDFAIESETMPLMASYAYSGLNLSKGSWLVVNDDMGRDAVAHFSTQFTKLGGEMISGQLFEISEMDLRNKISKVLDSDPEFIIVIGRGSAMINACRQIRERSMNLPIIGNNTMDNNNFWKALGTAGNNFWFPRPYTDYNSSGYIQANEQLKTKFGHEMNWLNLYGISIANYLAQGLTESSGDKEKVKAYLQNLKIQSIRGLLVMNKNGDVNTPHVVYRRKDGYSIPAENSK